MQPNDEAIPETTSPAAEDQQPAPMPKKAKSNAVVAVGHQVKPLVVTDMDGAWRMATAFSHSGMLPKAYYQDGKDAAIAKAFTAMQLGAEVGLPPMQSIQSIAIVNGVATIWGDTMKALVEQSGKAEYIRETYEGEWPANQQPNPNFKAICVTKRVGRDEVREEFSIQDAMNAGLWGKSGPWKTHPKRMLRYKVRAFALRDVYPDVLKGLTHSAEEMEGEMIDVTPKSEPAHDIMQEKPAEKMAGMFSKPVVKPEAATDKPGVNPTDGPPEMLRRQSTKE